MKRTLALFSFLVSVLHGFAESQFTDSILHKILIEKDEDKKVELLFDIFTPEMVNNTSLTIRTGQVLLDQAQEDEDLVQQAAALSFLGLGYRMSGNPIKALAYHQKALSAAEQSKNYSILTMAKNLMGHIYRDREEYQKALQLYKSALYDAEYAKNVKVKAWPLMNIGATYLGMNKPDSALYYLQRSYELALKVDTIDLAYVLWNLGGVHSKLGNSPLAVTYFNMSVQQAKGDKSPRQLSLAYYGLAEHFHGVDQKDSTIFYAKKAIDVVQHTDFFFTCIKPAALLASIYQKSNCDSTLKYTAIYNSASDSLYSTRATEQIQLMTFEEDLRQLELEQLKFEEEERRQQNIQYAAIALGIVTFIILFFLLSRSIIVNEKWISFFGILGLLIVFEFINLLIHPLLERVTHHTPLLMLLALVLLAAMLIPLHHSLEKLIKEKMTGKNRRIRLANAKKTIASLEEQTVAGKEGPSL